MKTLIDNVKTFLTTDLVSGTVKVVEKGLPEDPQQIPFNNYPYIALGDGGERTDDTTGSQNQNRVFSVLLVMAVYAMDKDTALDNILDLSNTVKASIESLTNRQVDGLIFGRSITTFDWSDEQGFYMGRTVTVEYTELEDIYFNY